MKRPISYTAAIILTAFGLLTLFLSSSIILDIFGIRAREGNYVSFVVWANFLSSLFYLSAAYGFIKSKTWTLPLLAISATVLIAAFIGLLIHINSGGIYETKTVGAMIFRVTVTLLFAGLAYYIIPKNTKK